MPEQVELLLQGLAHALASMPFNCNDINMGGADHVSLIQKLQRTESPSC